MLKRISIALLSLLMFTTIIPLPIVTEHESSAAYAPSCSLLPNKMKNTAQFLENLLNDYERSMRYARDPFHAEYRDRHIELAHSALEMALGRFDVMLNHLDSLLICKGDADIEKIEQALSQFLKLILHPTITDEGHENADQFFRKYTSIFNALMEFQEHPIYDSIYQMFLGSPSDDFKILSETVLTNVADSIVDKFLLRFPSFKPENSKELNFTIAADATYSVFVEIKAMIGDYIQAKRFSDYASFSVSAVKQLFSAVTNNVIAMTTKGLYKTLFQGAILPHLPMEQQELGDNIAGGLASLMTATDPISFGLAYAELIFTINDYNVRGLQQVQDSLERSRIANEHARMLTATSNFALQMKQTRTHPNMTDGAYTATLSQEIEKLTNAMLDIYGLDPDEIKIYFNNKKLEPTVEPFIQNGTTMVPLRLIIEQLGLDIQWDGQQKTITFSTEIRWRTEEIVMTIGSKTVQIGRRTATLLEAPVLINGTTFVPLRFISEQIGLNVRWIPESNSVVIEN